MLKVGDTVRWMCPLDHDYLYGEIVRIRDRFATVKGIGLYQYITAEVHFKYIKKVAGGGNCGGSKRPYQSLSIEGKL